MHVEQFVMNADVPSLDSTVAENDDAQREFRRWIQKRTEASGPRSREDHVDGIRNGPAVPDVRTLAGFLETIGFELISLEKQATPRETGVSRENVLRVEIECGTSRTRAVLELKDAACQCSNFEPEKTIANDPEPPSNVASKLENEPKECNTNLDVKKPEFGVTRSHTQPELRSRGDPKLWDLDIETASLDEEPRPSPPKMTSSPAIIDLSTSLGQISLPNEAESPRNVSQYIIGAQKNLEKALKMLFSKKPSVSGDLSPNQDQDTASVKSAPANISPENGSRVQSSSVLNTTCSIKQPTKTTNWEKPSLTKLSRVQSPKARRNIEPTLAKSHTRRSLQIEPGSTRRYSFGMASSVGGASSKIFQSDSPLKTSGSADLGNSKSKTTTRYDFPNGKGFSGSNKHSEPGGAPPTPNNTPNTRTRSLLKPPSKISVSKPASKLKPSTAINAGLAARRSTPSRE